MYQIHLLQKLSSDEQKELGQMLKVCTTEMTFTRGLPFAAAVIGSLYFARKRLPPFFVIQVFRVLQMWISISNVCSSDEKK
uniref:Uncharacterized protein n=1 Tax=Parascaris equorum TaxID=6256 RepID=A0A914R6D8_PAREQ